MFNRTPMQNFSCKKIANKKNQFKPTTCNKTDDDSKCWQRRRVITSFGKLHNTLILCLININLI